MPDSFDFVLGSCSSSGRLKGYKFNFGTSTPEELITFGDGRGDFGFDDDAGAAVTTVLNTSPDSLEL